MALAQVGLQLSQEGILNVEDAMTLLADCMLVLRSRDLIVRGSGPQAY